MIIEFKDSDISDNYNEHTDDIIKEFVPSLFQTTPLRVSAIHFIIIYTKNSNE